METERYSAGTIAEDPLDGIAAGFTLAMERRAFPPAEILAPGFTWTSFEGVMLQLLFGNDTSARVTGSAVMIAPGLALAAKHVIQPELSSLFSQSPDVFFATGLTSINGLEIWRVHQFVTIEDCDVVLLNLERKSAFTAAPRITQAIVSTRQPPIGSAVSICGFSASAHEFTVGDAIRGRVHASVGDVIEHYPIRRDSCMLPGPCFAVAVGTPGGLSGGPVFDNTGCLVGILSTSTGETNDDVSFVSAIYPILSRPVLPHWPKGLVKETTTLLEMSPRLCRIEGRDRVMALPNGGIAYSPWS